MKLNKFFLFAAAAIASVFSSCSSEDAITVGEQDSDKPFVYLSDANQTTFTLDPSEATELAFTVYRRDSVAAAEIPLTVTNNTDNIFNVPAKASFAAGSKMANVNVTFPNAPIGTPCSFTVGFDPEYAGIYKQGTREQTFTVTRVKWNSIGMGTMSEMFWFEDNFNVEIMQRDDKPTVYRVIKPFESYASILDGNQSDYIELTLLQPKDAVYDAVISKRGLVHFSTINTGYFYSTYGADVKMYHPSAFTSLCDESLFTHSCVLSYQADGKTPGQIQLAPYYYMDGAGGWNQTQADGMVTITFPGFVPQYEANIETDFEYDEAFEGEFLSGLLGTSTTTSLYVGKCTTTQDDCDKRFEEAHGKIYKLVSPYAEDYHLTFYIKKDAVALPDGSEYAAQPTGLTSLGKDVYAHINADNSSYDVDAKKLTLNITFTDKSGSVDYGTYDEIIENVKWSSLGEGLWTDAFLGPLFSEPAVTYPVEILECDNKPGLYRVMNVYSNSTYPYAENDCAADGSFITVDATDPDGVIIEKQDLGFDWSYGEMYLQSLGAYYITKDYSKTFLKTMGYLGTLKDGVITLPYLKASDDYSATAFVYLGDKAYFADTNNEFKLVLPSAVTSTAKAKAKAKAAKKSITKKFVGKKTNIKANKFAVRKSGKAPQLKSYIKTAPVKVF